MWKGYAAIFYGEYMYFTCMNQKGYLFCQIASMQMGKGLNFGLQWNLTINRL